MKSQSQVTENIIGYSTVLVQLNFIGSYATKLVCLQFLGKRPKFTFFTVYTLIGGVFEDYYNMFVFITYCAEHDCLYLDA